MIPVKRFNTALVKADRVHRILVGIQLLDMTRLEAANACEPKVSVHSVNMALSAGGQTGERKPTLDALERMLDKRLP